MGKDRISRYIRGNPESYLIALKGAQYANYRESWNECGSEQVLPDRPIQLNIELTARCNLRCKMCYRSYENPGQYRSGELSLATVKKLALEARDLGISSLWLTGGEPLLHPSFPEVLECLSKCGFLDFWLVTNGLLLDEATSRLICESGITWLSISIDACTDLTYRRIRGGSLAALKNNIEGFLRIREECGKGTPLLRVSFVQQEDNCAETEAFMSEWADAADVVDIQSLVSYHFDENSDISGNSPKKAGASFRCPDPFRLVSVLPDGAFAPCCNSFSKTRSPYTAGGGTISQYWSSEWHKQFADAIKKHRFDEECRKCIQSFTVGGVDAI